MKATDAKGYQDGINRAAEEYKKTARGMVNEALSWRIPDAFKVGYDAGTVAMAAVMQMEPSQGLIKQLAKPVVPKLNLPYIAEEW